MSGQTTDRYRVEIVTPAGRKRYLELLYRHLKKQKKDFDQWTLWINTKNVEDIKFCKLLEKENDWIKTINPILTPNSGWSIHSFFVYAHDPSTIYIRLDDDIIWLEDNFVSNLVNFRISHPDFFLVYANIINNAIIDHIHQRFGCIDYTNIIQYICTDIVGWSNSNIAETKHIKFLEAVKNNNLISYKFPKWILYFYERVSINAICWFGSEFHKFDGIVGHDEEQWLSVDKPRSIAKPNIICGDVLCSHFAFYTQREYLDKTNILQEYKKLIS